MTPEEITHYLGDAYVLKRKYDGIDTETAAREFRDWLVMQ